MKGLPLNHKECKLYRYLYHWKNDKSATISSRNQVTLANTTNDLNSVCTSRAAVYLNTPTPVQAKLQLTKLCFLFFRYEILRQHLAAF